MLSTYLQEEGRHGTPIHETTRSDNINLKGKDGEDIEDRFQRLGKVYFNIKEETEGRAAYDSYNTYQECQALAN